MNKKGGIGIAVIVSIMFFIIGLTMVNYITPEVTNARSASVGLDCTNYSGISDGTKLTCLAIDMAVPYFIILVLSAAGGFLSAKMIG